jgi:TonB family protein
MKIFLPLCLTLMVSGGLLHAQSGPQPTDKCKLQAVSSPKFPQAKPGGSFGGYRRSPIVAFEIDEAGTIQHSRIKRRSGSRAADDLALHWVQQLKYKPRPGCGVVESEADVTIDFTSE